MEAKSFFEKLQLQYVIPIIAIATSIFTFFTTVKEAEYKKQNTKIEQNSKLIADLKNKMEIELRQKEFKKDLKMTIYGEVKDAVTKEQNLKLKELTLIMVNSLLEDTTVIDNKFKLELIKVLVDSDKSKQIEKKQDEIDNLKKESYTIQVFYLDDIPQESFVRAKRVYDLLKTKYSYFTIKLSPLSKIQNSKKGYKIDSNQIRYEESESKVAKEIKALIDATAIFSLEQPELHPVNYVTPKYISVFIRNM